MKQYLHKGHMNLYKGYKFVQRIQKVCKRCVLGAKVLTGAFRNIII